MYSVRLGRSGLSQLARTVNVPSSTSFTMMCMTRPITTGTFQGILVFGSNSTSDYYYAGTDNSNNFQLYNRSAGFSGSAMVTNVWTHIAMTVSGTGAGQFLGYKDGALNITGDARAITLNELRIGNDFDNESYGGNVAAIKIYNRVLTADQINAERWFAMPVDWAGLNSAYPLGTAWDVANSGLVIPRGVVSRWPDVSGQFSEWTETGTIDVDSGPPIQFAPSWSQVRARYFTAAAPPSGGKPDLYYRMLRTG